jgi:Icc-related predicted phosphoesterase
MIFKKKSLDGTTIFFCSDLHGSTVCFKKFINAASYYTERGRKVDILMMGGDTTGKLIVPIIKQGGAYSSYLFGEQLTLTGQDEIDDLVKKTEVLGVYPHIFEPDEYDEFKNGPEVQAALFKTLMLRRLEEWMDIADHKLKDTGIPCYINPGNDDIKEVDEILKASQAVTYADGQVVQIDGQHEMMSMGAANITPFDCPRDVPEEELTRRLEAMVAQVSDMSRCILNSHVPPYSSGIDEAPLLDAELRPQIGMEGVEMVPVGSQAVREAIEKYQPMLGLHGHIHEGRGTAMIGGTLCINPGSEYSEGVLRGALVTVNDGQVVAHMFTSG